MIKKEDYTKYYETGILLGDGGFGIVYEGKDKKTNEKKALKIITKKRIKQFLTSSGLKASKEGDIRIYIKAFENEVKNMEILQGNRKENINAVILEDIFETKEEFVIVMEKCDNNLLKHLHDRGKSFNPDEIYEILIQLNNSFKIMVKNEILHRALKPQNILVKYQNKEKTEYLVKLKITEDSCSSNDSAYFLDLDVGRFLKVYAPEVLIEEKYTKESDLWSLGVLIYLLYFGEYPFKGKSKEEILNNILDDKILKLKPCQDNDLNNLIRELLIIEPNRRLTWEEYFNHSFFRKKMDFRDFYQYNEKEDFLANAEFRFIYKAIDKKTKEQKAIKIMDKNRIKNKLLVDSDNPLNKITDDDLKPYINDFLKEVNHMKILQGLNNENKNTVVFNEYFDTKKEFVIVMELCDANLLQYVTEEKKNGLTFEEIHEIISQLNNSFEIMVKNKILHRALKSENILMKYENKEKSKYIVKLKLTDDTGVLGSSLPKNIDKNLKVYAPEVLKGEKYTEKSDLWSLGVLIYFLYFNKLPFEGKTKEEILNKIENGINGELTKNKDFDDLLKKLLNKNDEERITWSDYFKHRFFRINQDYTKFYEIEIGKDEKKVELGRDGYGIVYKAKDLTGKPKAIKIMDKGRIKDDILNDQDEIIPISEEDLKPYIDRFFNEVNHMKILQGVNNQNRNTVIFNEYFNTNENFVIVMELCDDNLYNYISNKNYLNFGEIQDILIQLNNSFKIMFNNKILHRAIKPGNVLYKKIDDSKLIFKLKLTDACCLSKESSKIDINEIPFKQNLIFYAPEILNGEKYTEESDLWSLGILIYFMKLKRYPFPGKNKKEVLDNITKAMKREETKNISENSDFNDLVNNLLVVDPKKRMSWKEYFRHPFLNNKISG